MRLLPETKESPTLKVSQASASIAAVRKQPPSRLTTLSNAISEADLTGGPCSKQSAAWNGVSALLQQPLIDDAPQAPQGKWQSRMPAIQAVSSCRAPRYKCGSA